jgi:hypothetical protein
VHAQHQVELDKRGESGSTSVIYLKHADAKSMLPVLQGVAKQIGSGRASRLIC